MKKWLLMIPCLLICCLLISVPVAAASSVQLELQGEIVDGQYSGHALVDSGDSILVLDYNGSSIVFEGFCEPDTCCSFYPAADGKGIGCIEVCFSGDVVQFNFVDENYEPLNDLNCTFTLTYYGFPYVPVKGGSHTLAVSVFDVFTGIGSWLVGALGSVSGIFWNAAAGELTVLGILAISALGVGLILALIAIIGRFLCFRS